MLFTRTARVQPRGSSGLGSNGKREILCPTQQMNNGEPPCPYIAHISGAQKGTFSLGRCVGKGISVLYSGKVLKEPLLLCVGHLFSDVK